MRLIKPIVLALAVASVSGAQPLVDLRPRHLRRHLGGDHRGGPGQADGQDRRGRQPRRAPRRLEQRRPRVHRYRRQVGDRRPLARVLPARLGALRQAGGVEVAEARGVRQQGPGHAGDRRRAADDVDLRAARGRAGVRGPGPRARHRGSPRRVARTAPAACGRTARASPRSPCSAAAATPAGCSSTRPTKAT